MTKLKVQEQKRRVEHKHTHTSIRTHTHTDSRRRASIVYKQEHTHTHTFTHNYTIRWINELLNLSFDYLCVCVSIICICMYMRRYRYQVFGTCKIYSKFADDVDLNLCKTQKGNKHTYIHMYGICITILHICWFMGVDICFSPKQMVFSISLLLDRWAFVKIYMRVSVCVRALKHLHTYAHTLVPVFECCSCYSCHIAKIKMYLLCELNSCIRIHIYKQIYIHRYIWMFLCTRVIYIHTCTRAYAWLNEPPSTHQQCRALKVTSVSKML